MIFTARQLEEMHTTSGDVRLPLGARLTPLANDWLRRKGLRVAYDGQAKSVPALATATSGTILWWCDGPCAQAKAALAAQAREAHLQPLPVNPEPKNLVAAVKQLASEIKADRAAAGVLFVQTGAAAVVFANRCPSLRAILGTCREAVQQGAEIVGANVLVIEHPYQTLLQVRNLLSQFVRVRRDAGEDVKRQLQELASCA